MPFPHVFIKLTDQERNTVAKELTAFSIKGKFKKRKALQVLWLSDQGFTFQSIGQRLNYSYIRVRQLIYLYRKQGLKPFLSP
ncbi:MAG: helix-turn-helix domain-containing protein [Planctomycetes bacterium]|nr:helix-turn-helix domain-containing protein [Planctomycetota bacterium]